MDDSLRKQITPHFQGSRAERGRVANQLINADFGGEFAFDLLAQTIAETTAAGVPMTTSVQNLIASKVRGRFQQSYDQYSKSTTNAGGQPLDYNNYFAKNKQAYMDVLQQPIDLSNDKYTTVPGTSTRVDQLVPGAFGATTVQQGMRWLSLSQTPSVWQQVTKPAYDAKGNVLFRQANEENIGDEYMSGWSNAFQNIHNYDPAKGGSFAVYWTDQAAKGIRKFRDWARDARTGQVSATLLEGEDNESNYGGYEVNGETGELSDVAMDGMESAGIADHEGIAQRGGLPDYEHFTEKPPMPAGNWQNSVTRVQDQYAVDDVMLGNTTEVGIQTGAGGRPSTWANNLRFFGIDPNSAAGRAGMQEGALVASLGRIFHSKNFGNFLAAVENGSPFDLQVMQQKDGRLQEQTLTINPDPVTGRTIDSQPTPNWVERLSGAFDSDYSGSVHTLRGGWDADRLPVSAGKGPARYADASYAELPADVSTTTSKTGIATSLFTTKPEYAGGMYETSKGNWKLAPLSSTPSDTFNVPVQLNPTGIKKFGQLYGAWKEAWNYYEDVYNQAGVSANDAVHAEAERIKGANGGNMPAFDFTGKFKAEVEARLPSDAARPGSREFSLWQNASTMLGELRGLEKSVTGSVPFDQEEMSIQTWDSIASTMDSTVAKDLYDRKWNPKQYAQAQKSLSRAGNYLMAERQARYQAARVRTSSPGVSPYIPGNPADRNALNLHAPLPVGVERMDRGLRLSSLPLFDDPGEAAGPANGSGGASLGVAQARADRGLGDAQRLIYQEGDPPSRGTGGQQATPDMLTVEGSEYLNLSDQRASSRFQPGQMREDNWEWKKRGADTPLRKALQEAKSSAYRNFSQRSAPNFRDEHKITENTFDTSLLGGNPDDLEASLDNFGNYVERKQVQKEEQGLLPFDQLGQEDGQPIAFDAKAAHRRGVAQITRQEIVHSQPSGPDTIPVESGKDEAYNRREGTFVPARGRTGVEDANVGNPDRIIQQRAELDAVRQKADNELIDTEQGAEVVSQDAFQKALSIIPNARDEESSIPNEIAAIGAERGVYNVNWREVFNRLNDKHPEGPKTYSALTNNRPSDKELSEELQFNLQSFQRLGRKDLIVKTRMGENPTRSKEMENNPDPKAVPYFRESLKMINEQHGLNLSYTPGNETEFYNDLAGLAKSNPQAFQQIQSIFAEPGDQVVTSRQWMASLGKVSGDPAKGSNASRTPAPARGSSHRVAAGVGGRGMAKWSLDEQRRKQAGAGDPFENTPTPNMAPEEPADLHPNIEDLSGQGGDGNPPPPGVTTAAPPPEDGGRKNGKIVPNTDPADFPMTPGGEGYKMSWTRYDPKTQHGVAVSAIGRKDAEGKLSWMTPNEQGELEPLRVNKGWGRIEDEQGQLIHNVDRKERERYNLMNAPLSSAGNSAATATPAPQRVINNNPAEFPDKPEEGMLLEFREFGGKNMYLHAAKNEDSGEMYWARRQGDQLAPAGSPGYGTVRNKQNEITHQVTQMEYERFEGENAKPRQELPPAPAFSRDTPQPQRAVSPAMSATRVGATSAFSRFNMKLNEANAVFTAGKLQTSNPKEYGLHEDDREGFRRGISNEFYGKVSASWNAMADNIPASVDEVANILGENLGLEPEEVMDAAQEFWKTAQNAPMSQGKRVMPKERSFAAGVSKPARKINNDVDIAARGAPGFRTLAGNRAGELDEGIFDDFKSPSLGETWVHPYEDSKGNTHMSRSLAVSGKDATGKVEMMRETASPEQLTKGKQWAQTAFNEAISGELPTSPDAIFATVKERMYSSIKKQMMDEVDHAEKGGMSVTQAGRQGNIIKELADHAAKKVQDVLKTSLEETVGEVSSLATEGSRTDTRVGSLDEAKKLYTSNANVRDALGSRSIESAFNSPDQTVLFGDDDRSYNLGGEGGGGNRRGPKNGMFGSGGFGAMFYGAYMLKREWQMAAAPTFQAAQKYGESMSEYAPMLYEGSNMSNSDAGFEYRQERGESYMGKAAYSAFGAFMDVPYQLSQTGSLGAARAIQAGGIGAGVGAGGLIGASMLAGANMGGAAAVLGPAGLALGAGIAVAGLGMEAYNAALKPPGEEDVTFSSVWNNTITKPADITNANAKRVADKFGGSYEDYLAKPSRMHGKQYSNKQEWFNAKVEAVDTRDGNAPTAEELADYMDTATAAKYMGEDRAAELASKVGIVQGETLENEGSLQKALLLQKRLTGKYDTNQLMGVSQTSARLGMGSDENLSAGASVAGQLGFVEGTPDFERAMMGFSNLQSPKQRAEAQYTAARTAGFGSQIQAVMGSEGNFAGKGSRFVTTYGLDNQQKAGAFTSIASGMQQQGANLSLGQYDQIAAITRDNSPMVAGVIGNAMEGFMSAGMSTGAALQAGGILSGAGMSQQDAGVYQRMMQGDLGAYSYQAWQSGNMDNAFLNRAGQSITQTSGSTAMQVYNAWAPKIGMSGGMTTQKFLGTDNAAINKTFSEDGFQGLQLMASEASYNASMASAGIQMKGIALQENYLWGNDKGGTWSNPTAGSSWGIEDRSTALQRQSQQANFADQWQRMTTSNNFGIQREGNQAERMGINNAYQSFQFSQQYNQFQKQQIWTQQDWQTQDTTRQLNNGWQMEDLNENIRFATGRQRKQLVKQRDRAALSQNMEEETVETQRDRQKEMWAQQEEAYEKQKQYMGEMQRLDQESFDINKKQRETFFKMDVEAYDRRLKEYEEETKLQDEARDLGRKYQYDQIQLQKEAAGVQAAAAAAQHEINKAIAEGQKKWEEMVGSVEQMNKYNNAFRTANATAEMFGMMDGVSEAKLNKIIALFREVQNTSPRVGGERD